MQLRKGILQMMSASVLNKVVSLISYVLVTRLLSVQEYGLWSFVQNQYSYLVLISGFGLLSGAFQFGTENRNQKEEFEYYSYCLKNGLLINSVLLLICFILSFWMDFSLEGVQGYLRVYLPILLLEYILNLLLTVLRCENRISEYARILNLNTVLIALGTCVGALWGITGIIVGKYLSYLFSIAQVVKKTRTESKKIKAAQRIRWPQTRSLWHYSLFVGASSAMNCLIHLMDISMIANLIKDPILVAVYKVATIIPVALSFIPNSIVVALLPNIVQNRNNIPWLKKNIKKMFLGMGLFNLVLCCGLYLFAPIVIAVMSGKQYLSAVPIFRILMAGYFFEGTFRLLSTNILAGLRCVNYGLFVSITSAVIDIVFNLMLIPNYEMAGAAYASLGAMVVSALLAFGYLIWMIYGKERKKEC